MGLKDWLTRQLQTEEGRKAAVDLAKNEEVREVAQELMKNKVVRETAREVMDSEMVRHVAREAARGALQQTGDRVRQEARKITDQLTEPIRDYQRRKDHERQEREQQEAEDRAERELDAELATLKRKLDQ